MNSIWLAIFLPAIITTPCCDSIASFNRALTIAFVAICLLLIKDWVIVQMQSTLAHSVVREKPKRQLITRQQSPKRWLNHRKKMDIPSLNLKNISASPGREQNNEKQTIRGGAWCHFLPFGWCPVSQTILELKPITTINGGQGDLYLTFSLLL